MWQVMDIKGVDNKDVPLLEFYPQKIPAEYERMDAWTVRQMFPNIDRFFVTRYFGHKVRFCVIKDGFIEVNKGNEKEYVNTSSVLVEGITRNDNMYRHWFDGVKNMWFYYDDFRLTLYIDRGETTTTRRYLGDICDVHFVKHDNLVEVSISNY